MAHPNFFVNYLITSGWGRAVKCDTKAVETSTMGKRKALGGDVETLDMEESKQKRRSCETRSVESAPNADIATSIDEDSVKEVGSSETTAVDNKVTEEEFDSDEDSEFDSEYDSEENPEEEAEFEDAVQNLQRRIKETIEANKVLREKR